MREALAAVCEEGLEHVVKRHEDAAAYLADGLKRRGWELFVAEPANRLPTITSIVVPKSVDWKAISDFAAKSHSMEIAGGLGPTAGEIIRIGLMGENGRREYADQVLAVLDQARQLSKL